MQVVITIEGSQADVFEQEPDEPVSYTHLTLPTKIAV